MTLRDEIRTVLRRVNRPLVLGQLHVLVGDAHLRKGVSATCTRLFVAGHIERVDTGGAGGAGGPKYAYVTKEGRYAAR